eukprot:CAMPEP_0197200014 /NCGR_PEP_ID=MMETSP1423-20130617/34176_1 /TAXON_ID=476441 /ORGANISM="Pseudo-nitzschia heimii, Strain UNC1101" /LENGTH=571 /DNA_ID=CAMNT_0042653887 /DNA_START=294 /DNA_END=2010 /DNA_ORIENTATION=-
MPKSGVKKKKPRVEEVDGVLWLLDEKGNRVKKVKKKVKSTENNGSGQVSNHSNESGKKKKHVVKEIDGQLYQVDEHGKPIKKVRQKSTPQEPPSGRDHAERRRRATSHGPVAGRRSAAERLDTGTQRLRSNSLGRTTQKAGEYIDAKGRKVVIDEDGNKTVYDKKGRRLRPKRKKMPIPIEPRLGSMPEKLQLSSHKPEFHDRRQDLMKSSIYESGRFDALWADKPMSPGFKGSQLSPLKESGSTLLGRPDLLTKYSASNIMNGSSRTLGDDSNQSNPFGSLKSPVKSNEQIDELSKQVTEYGEENRDLKSQLMNAEEKIRALTQQNQREKSKNVRATTEMLQLKADYQQATDEKRDMGLQIKNLAARYREKEEELEKIENTPANRRITTAKDDSGGSDHLVQQITDLMAENDALLVKLDISKQSSGHDVKKKEEQILFLNEELRKLREENDMLFRGEAEKDPLMAKLFKQKKGLEEAMKQEKEKSSIRIQSLQETVDALEKSNAALRKDLEKATLQINDDDDDEVRRAKEMAQAVANRGTSGNALQVKRSAIMAQNSNDEEVRVLGVSGH